MFKKLIAESVIKFVLGVLVVGMLIFIPAGTFLYKNGWVFMSVQFVPMFIAGLVMMVKNPQLLKKRMNAKEQGKAQKIVIFISGLIFALGFIAAGLNYRLGWYTLPNYVSTSATVAFLAGYFLYAQVLRQNPYLSRTVEIQDGQKVVSDGLYGVVRHPMYTATLIMFLAAPLILGSIYSLLVFAAYPFAIVKRIKAEEELLKKELLGYADYMKKVKFRVVPFIW